MNNNPWCAMFVSWCAYQADILNTTVPKFSYCPAGADWYRARERFIKHTQSYIPNPGDLVFFNNQNSSRISHVGIIYQIENSHFYTIEGNIANAVSSNSYLNSNSQIYGYGINSTAS